MDVCICLSVYLQGPEEGGGGFGDAERGQQRQELEEQYFRPMHVGWWCDGRRMMTLLQCVDLLHSLPPFLPSSLPSKPCYGPACMQTDSSKKDIPRVAADAPAPHAAVGEAEVGEEDLCDAKGKKGETMRICDGR